MIIKIIEYLAYTGTIAALLATTLSIFTFLFLSTAINYLLLILIFTGTLTIYNIDHLRDLNYDQATNPLRANFIRSNKTIIYLIAGLSIFTSIISLYFIGFNIIPILLIPFLLGLLHRRLKGNPLFSAIYVTIAWLIVTIYLPSYLADKLNHILLLSLIIGIILFSNAYTASIRQKFYAFKHARYLIYLSILALIIILVLRGNYTGIIPLAFFTTIALLNFRNDENYEIIYFDGLQLSGSVMSVLFLKLINI